MKNLATLVTFLAGGIISGSGTEAYSKPQKLYVIIPNICLPETVKLEIPDEKGRGYLNDPHPSIQCQDDQQRAVVCTTNCYSKREQDDCTYIAEICYIAKLPKKKEPPKTESLPQ